MKLSSIYYFIPFCVLGLLSIGCQTPAQKVDDAQENVAEAKQDLKEVVRDANAEIVQKANDEEWRLFKNETDLKFKDTENQIDEWKAKMKSSGRKMDAAYTRNMENLDQKIAGLKDRITGYERTQSDWVSFKREFNHDMDELGNALKDLTVDNKR